MYTENALLFPRQVIPSLRGLRGKEWDDLIERVFNLPECHEEHLAFMMMMIQLNGCVPCETDSYRAMRGCCSCAQQTIRRFKGTDEELLGLFQRALEDVRHFALKGSPIANLIQGNLIPINSF
ncbi:MAG: hypothetical protein MUF87_07475 [Anaerolineae bacterium]|jgi:hypothetical protein|nr:hypothetical protein [Anaerolineae bacterium]